MPKKFQEKNFLKNIMEKKMSNDEAVKELKQNGFTVVKQSKKGK